MYLTFKIGDYTLAVLRYAYPDEPEGVYCKTMYQNWTRLPLQVSYTSADEVRVRGIILETLPEAVRAHVNMSGDL